MERPYRLELPFILAGEGEREVGHILEIRVICGDDRISVFPIPVIHGHPWSDFFAMGVRPEIVPRLLPRPRGRLDPQQRERIQDRHVERAVARYLRG